MRLAAVVLALAGLACAADAEVGQRRLVKTVSLGVLDGWDFLHFEPARGSVDVSHETEITLVDGTGGAMIGRISRISIAHDVAVVPEFGRG